MRDVESVVIATPDGSYELELLPEFGGRVNSMTYSDGKGWRHELIAGLPDRVAIEQDRYYRNVPLYPFANRLDAGSYRHLGSDYRFSINEPVFNNALHGFLYTLVPEVKVLPASGADAAVELHYHYKGDKPGYPFAAEVLMRFVLQPDTGLTLAFEVRNLHHEAVPLGIGWHPYWTLGQPVDELLLLLPPVQRVEVDARLLPTGQKSAFNRFAKGGRLTGVQMDDCLELRPQAGERVSWCLWSPARSRGIEMWQNAAEYPYLQVFIPPDRQSIAIEPVSCGINAFANGEGLRHLEPGQLFSARCGVRMITPGSGFSWPPVTTEQH